MNPEVVSQLARVLKESVPDFRFAVITVCREANNPPETVTIPVSASSSPPVPPTKS